MSDVLFLSYGAPSKRNHPFLIHSKGTIGTTKKSMAALTAVPYAKIQDQNAIVSKECPRMRPVSLDLCPKFRGNVFYITLLERASSQDTSPKPSTAALE